MSENLFRSIQGIAGFLGCPTDTDDSMVQCMKYERSAAQIAEANQQYVVSYLAMNEKLSTTLSRT